MASGGVTKKGVPSNGNYKQRQNPQDQQWTVLPNNLDLRSNSQSSKKQRNKEDYPTESSPQYNIMPSNNSNNHSSTPLPSNKTPSGSQQKGQQFLADVETGYQNVFRQPGDQHSHYQSQHTPDVKGRKMSGNSGRKPYKENNTHKIPDTNAIVERLGHLRDYMKDVTSVMGSLEKSDDPATREQKKKLSHMLRQLQQEEQQHFNLLQQMLTTNDEQLPEIADDTNPVINPVDSNDRETNGDVEERIEHGQKLLKKMIESQEKMQSLKKQEADLLSMQKEAETKLAEAKAFHSTLVKREKVARNENERYSFPAEWNYISQDNPSYGTGEGISNGSHSRERCSIGVPTNLERLGEGDHSHTVQANNEELVPTGFEAAFENLKHRLQHLKDMSNNNNNNNQIEQQLEQVAVEASEPGDSKMEWHRKKLENKLKELQEKKKHMDTMLVELSVLEQASADIKNGHTNSNQLKTADSSMEEAQHLLDTIDAREKMKKLEEMKESLKQLRSLVNSIQPSTNAELLSQGNEDHIETISNSSRSSSQVTQHRAETPRSQQYQQSNSQPKKDNIRRDKSNKFPVRRHYEAEGRANEDGDNIVPSSSTRSSLSNIDDSWETDPQIQDKVRKLQDAKEKLQRLQSLMSAVENSKGTDYPSTVEYLQLLSAISDEDKQEEEGLQESQLNSNESKGCHEEETVGGHQDIVRLDAVEERMQEQEKELQKLMEERIQLLSMQNQLTKMQQHFKNAHGASEERLRLQQKSLNQSCSNSNSSSSRGLSPCHQLRAENCLSGRQNLSYETASHANSNMKSHTEGRMAVTKKENINSMSANLSGRVKRGKDDQAGEGSSPNATIDSLLMQGNDLDHNITLQELKQNVLLEDILRQSHNKRGYSHNEDVHSQSCSSANSEFQEGSNSVLAPDTTVAATWGGSSTQNDLEDEHVESLEEQEGSEVEMAHEENIWQSQNRKSPVQQPFRREIAQGEQDTDSQVRRNNRLGSHNFKDDHVNRWNARKNFHQNQQRNHLSSTSNQDAQGNLCTANRLNTEETGQAQNLITTDGTCNTTVWQQFTNHIHQQLEHMNTLCQSIFHDQQALTSCFLSSSISPPLVGRSSHPVISDNWLQNTYQFQQQQQLLLNLSQCYHMIHLQQLEIQYLHQCLQQHPDGEHAVVQTSPVVNQEHVPEEFTFRPWLTAPSNTQGSFPSVQNSSVPSSAFVQSNVDSSLMPIISNAPSNSFNIPAQTSNCNFAGQNVVSATLNNQVPPRTRANNFWDNFRSYSRQNMLSTSKSNEALSTNVSAPQLQSPLVDNIVSSSSWNRQPHVRSQPCIENATQTNCLKGRRVPNTKLQEIMIKSKKPNASKDRRQAGFINKSVSSQQPVLKPKFSSGKDFQQSEAPPVFRTCPLQNASTLTESGHSFFQTYSDNRTGELEQRSSGNVSAVQESVYSEVSKIISQVDGKPDLLLEFLKRLKHLSFDSQQSSSTVNFSGGPEHQATVEDFHLKNKPLTSNTARDLSDMYSDCRVVTPLPSQFPLKDMQEDRPNYTTCQLRSESSQVTSIGSSTGAVRKRSSSKRSKAEHVFPVVSSSGSTQCTENSKEKISRSEKQEIHAVTEQELDIMPEQEERGAVGVDMSSVVGNRSVQIAEEDMGYECDPEGEIEPDVEAETDDTKDLAEADQSPGQRDHTQHFRQTESLSAVGGTSPLFSGSILRTEATSAIVTSSDIMMANSDEQQDAAAAAAIDAAVHIQPSVDDLSTVDELTLDDIPTKLTALSEEEVQRQMAEEVVATSLLHDVLSEELSDVAKEQGTF